jgi:serine/threonine protein kinase
MFVQRFAARYHFSLMGTSPKPSKADAPPPLAIKLGDVVLDRYRIVEQIASGGHSVVFRGTDERLSRPVCVKVFSGFGGNSGVGRTSYEHFVQEAFALSRLTHPNTLRIYDFGHLGPKDADGMPLQVCEYMSGGTLSQIIREQGKQSLAETVRIIHAMCLALSEAHGLGIVHRDIKPQNILFGSVGVAKLPKLADFGIAKWSDDDDNTNKRRAEDTAIVAGQKLAMYSPSWAAPEQLAGQPVNPTTDIYSLACVAVYMLSGKAIFADEDVYAGYRKRRHAEQLVGEALKPLHIAPSVVQLFSKALAFDPKKRLTNIDDLAAALTAALEPSTDEQPHLPAVDPAPAQIAPAQIAPRATQPGVHAAATGPVARHVVEASPLPLPLPPPHQPTPAPAPLPAPPIASAPIAAPISYPAFASLVSQQPAIADFLRDPPAPAAPPQLASPTPSPMPFPPAPAGHAGAWTPPAIVQPWMVTAPTAQGVPRRLLLSDLPQPVGDRRVHFLHAFNNVADLGADRSKVRVTFLSGPGGARVLHLKGMTCFVAHLGGRPSPAVHLDHASDIALVTPRAQEIGHIRVATGTSGMGQSVFPVGAELVALASDDCMDAILFDFGPGSDAYFVYTRGRPIPRSRRG